MMYSHKSKKHIVLTRLPLKEDAEGLLGEYRHAPSRTQPKRRSSPLLEALLLFVFILGTSALSFYFGRRWEFGPTSWSSQITQYSPILEDVPLSYSLTRFNGSLLKENIYRRPASPDVDAAWASLGANFRALIVPESLAKKSGLAPDQVKVNQKYGGGYPANVEGLHHLHCLNLLRQSLWYNFDYYHEAGQGAFKNEDYIVKFHVSHCLDILRQQLMCTVDVGVLGQVWLHPAAPEAYVDFNTEHKCRSFEAIRDWAEARQMPEKVPEDWLEPPKLGDRIYEEIP